MISSMSGKRRLNSRRTRPEGAGRTRSPDRAERGIPPDHQLALFRFRKHGVNRFQINKLKFNIGPENRPEIDPMIAFRMGLLPRSCIHPDFFPGPGESTVLHCHPSPAVRRRDGEKEKRASGFRRFEAAAAPLQLHQAPNDRQPQAPGGIGFMQAVE